MPSERAPRGELWQESTDPFGSPPGEIVPGIVRIAVVTPDDLREFLLTLPALASLQATYPAATITLIAPPWLGRFLAGRPGPFDEVVPQTHLPTGKLDVVFQMARPSPNSEAVLKRLQARIRIGPATRASAGLQLSIAYDERQPSALRQLELVSLLGVRPATLVGRIYLVQSDLAAARRALPEAGSDSVVLLTEGSRPAGELGKLAGSLSGRGIRAVIAGSRSDRSAVRQTQVSVTAPQPPVAAPSLRALAGVLGSCALAVGPESGLLQLARCLGTRTLSICTLEQALQAEPLPRRLHRVCFADEALDARELLRLTLALLRQRRRGRPRGSD